MPRIRAETIAEHRALTRSQVLEAAQRLIAEVGSADITLGEIASAVGIGRTTLYEYFSDRDDVIASLVEEHLPGVVRRLIASVPQGLSAPEHLVEVAVRTIRFVATDRVLGVILHRGAGSITPSAQQRIRIAHTDLLAEVADVYARGVREGTLRAFPADLAGRFFQDAVMSAARAVIASPDPDADLDDILAALRTFLLHGFAV